MKIPSIFNTSDADILSRISFSALENGCKDCINYIYNYKKMLCNGFCRCGGDEIIEGLRRQTYDIHDVLTKCNLNRSNPDRLRELLIYIRELQPHNITKDDIVELSDILTSKSSTLLWSVAFQCIANQPAAILDLNAVLDTSV